MKYRNWLLAVLLLTAVLGVGAFALTVCPGDSEPAQQPNAGGLLITELCARNESVIADNNGKYRDYIEISAQGQDASLAGCTLRVNGQVSAPLEDITILAGSCRFLFLGEEQGISLRAAQGQTIGLYGPDGALLTQVQAQPMTADQVMLLVDGEYTVSDQASPGFPNTPQGLSAFREGFAQEDPKLVLSELLVRNRSVLPDEKGSYCDVVELHNVSGGVLKLGDYYLSDRQGQRFRYRLPEMELAQDGYLVIYCDGENDVASDGSIHANFALSYGESIFLTDPTGGYLSLCGDEAGEDLSIQRDEAGQYSVGTPSLGFANTPEGAALALAERTNDQSPLVISEVLLSSSGMPYEGVLGDVIELQNMSDQPVDTNGWYLSDGGDPYRFPLPQQILQPGQCLVLRCGEEGTGFGLSQGETLRLTGPDHRHAPLLTVADGEPGQSISLVETGQEASYTFADVSIGYPNTQEGQALFFDGWQPQGLRISEVMTSNRAYLRGPYGAYADWVELYNAGTEPVSLKEYTLSDNAGALDKCQLPDRTLKPGEYIVILLDTSDNMLIRGYEALPMALSAKGDSLYLVRNGQVEDLMFIPELSQNTTYGRVRGSMHFAVLDAVTLAASNGSKAEKASDPVALTKPGVYEGVAYLDVELQGEGELYYTTNCNQPNQGSRRYTGPIRITETTVFRVVSYEPGKSRSEVISFTYLLNEGDTLPVVSLVTDPANLWDYETGIYADGPNITDEVPYYGANYWNRWERKASVTLYEKDGTGFSEPCAVRIFGGWSRRFAKKSLVCFFRGVYGTSRLEYPLFGEDSLPYYEAFVLRSGGQDVNQARMRDELITSMASQYLGLPVQDYRPVALYLNGEYWGIYNIREKLGESYVAGHYNVDADTVEIREDTQQGFLAYNELVSYVLSHDMTKEENYAYLAARMDLQNYTDYIAAQLWVANNDTINLRYFQAEGLPITWILFDTDVAFWSYYDNTLVRMLNPYALGRLDRFGTTFFLRLIENPQYKDYFLKRLAWQMNHVWTQENIIARVDEIQSVLAPDMGKETKRWGNTYEAWEHNVEQLRVFARERNQYFPGFVQRYFDLTDEQMVEYGFVSQ